MSHNSQLTPHQESKSKTAPATTRLDKARHNVIWDLDEKIPEVQKAFFYDNLLPPSPLPERTTVPDVVSALKAAADGINANGNWSGWNAPSLDSKHEDTVFSNFPELVDRIRRASAITDRRVEVAFKCNPTSTLISRTRNNTSKPDCYGILTESQLQVDPHANRQQPHWLDVAVPGEFKKNSDKFGYNFRDNAAKVLWSMNHLMREDARRRFVIGFTIEDVYMRLWYCSRSDVFVSEAFNWQVDHASLVDFVLRISFADPVALGWDPTITLHGPCIDGKPVRYDIVVRDQEANTKTTFRTKNMISNIGADTLRGRGTRVWEVIELDGNGKEKGSDTFALKDVWVDDERAREGDILKDIRTAAAKSDKPKKALHAINTYFLTVVAYGDVHVQGEADKTRKWTMPACLELKKIKNEQKEFGRVTSHLAPVGAISVERGSNQPVNQYFTTKCHHRIVFSEVGKTIQEVESLCVIFKCIASAAIALGVLHKLGWVHRDISSGNILVVDGKVKIADLEYAKRINDPSKYGIRTGTMYFMSIEVDAHQYLYLEQLSRTHAHAEVDVLDLVDTEEEPEDTSNPDAVVTIMEKLKANEETLVPFKYNLLHDMESLLWLALFLLVASTTVDAGKRFPEITEGERAAQHQLAANLFCDIAFRRGVMQSGTLKSCVSPLHPRIAGMVLDLETMRSYLTNAFIETEKDLAGPMPSYVAKSIYAYFHEQLHTIHNHLQADDIVVAADEVSYKRLMGTLAKKGKTESIPATEQANQGEGEDSDIPPAKKQRTQNAASSSSSQSHGPIQLRHGLRTPPRTPSAPSK